MPKVNKKSLSVQNEHLCSRCKKNPAEADHSCPFSEEINNDFESQCDCCDDCAYECAMDI